MIVIIRNSNIGPGLFAMRLCSQAQQVRTTVIGKRQRKAVTVFVRIPRFYLKAANNG